MPRTRLNRSLRATFLGLAVNGVLATVKLIAGLAGNSQALVADAIESMSDMFSSLVVWRGLVVASEPEDEDHPYGHGKAEPMSSAIVSLMLLMAAAWIAVQSVHEISSPHANPAPYTLLVLVIVIAIKESLFRHVLKEAVTVESTAVQTDAWHHRSDAITSLAAALGITVALIGGTEYAAADDVAALFAAGMIAWNGWRLLSVAASELMDRSPPEELRNKVRSAAMLVTGVENVEKCVVRKMGYHHYVDMHVEVDPGMTVEESHSIAHQVKDRIREQVPSVRDVLIHIEPARSRPRSSSS